MILSMIKMLNKCLIVAPLFNFFFFFDKFFFFTFDDGYFVYLIRYSDQMRMKTCTMSMR